MQKCVWGGFSILLHAADAVMVFGYKLNMYYIAAFPQEYCRLCLILNLSGKLNEGTPSVNHTMEKEVAPDSMKF